ncbi:MAG TPA: hypothetical protein PLR44_05610 [Thermomicrobiales bacterium]|nr:hypothetical protein [Thermomicrobiales bacterium]HRA32527.1 hypothetical protein [Thermomicrobiales bacterium]
MVDTYLPAWCERGSPGPDGRYVVACYFNRDGHPVTRGRAQRVQVTEYAPDGTALRVRQGTIDDWARAQDIVFSGVVQHFNSWAAPDRATNEASTDRW